MARYYSYADIDANQYKNMVRNQDFKGIHNLIFNTYMPNEYAQREMQGYVKTIDRNASFINNLLDNATNNRQREMLQFSLQKAGGEYSERNTYAQSYANMIKQLGGEDASVLTYSFDGDEYYRKFVETYGSEIPSDTASDMWKETIDGKPVIHVNKTLFSSNADLFNNFTKAINTASKYNAHWYDVFKSNAVDLTSNGTQGAPTDTENHYMYTEGYSAGAKESLLDKQSRIATHVQDADDMFENVRNEVYNKTVPADIIVGGFYTKKHKMVFEGVGKGYMGTEQANFYLKQIDQQYENRLLGGITHYEAYFVDHAEGNHAKNFVEADPDKKAELSSMIIDAINEKRLTYQIAMSGGRTGTYITIASKRDTGKANHAGYEDIPEGYDSQIEIFVPGLFEEEANEIFDSDEEGRLLRLKGDHALWGHDYELSDGGKLSNITNDGAIWVDAKGNKQSINAEELDMMMRKNEQIVEAAYKLNEEVWKRAEVDERTGEIKNDVDEIKNSEEVEELARNYAKNLYKYNNNITDDEQLKTEEAQEDIARTTALMLYNLGASKIVPEYIRLGIEEAESQILHAYNVSSAANSRYQATKPASSQLAKKQSSNATTQKAQPRKSNYTRYTINNVFRVDPNYPIGLVITPYYTKSDDSTFVHPHKQRRYPTAIQTAKRWSNALKANKDVESQEELNKQIKML